MREPTIDAEVETWLREVAAGMTEPGPRECLMCFVRRMLEDFGCDNRLRFAPRFRDLRAPRAVGLERRLGERGAFCDCEMFLNGWSSARHLWTPEQQVEHDGWVEVVQEAEPPATMPPCDGVRLGSTQPCGHWERRRRDW